GLMDAFATSISMALQYGVPLEALVEKFSHVRFEPSGFTKNPEIPYAKSITDYIFRYLASKFLSAEQQQAVGVQAGETSLKPQPAGPVAVPMAAPRKEPVAFRSQADAPSCHYCGSIMTRNGSCYRCANCGSTSGCSLDHRDGQPPSKPVRRDDEAVAPGLPLGGRRAGAARDAPRRVVGALPEQPGDRAAAVPRGPARTARGHRVPHGGGDGLPRGLDPGRAVFRRGPRAV